MSLNGPLRVGIGGPVGAGKTTLTEQLARALAPRLSMAVITNDIYTREDAEALMRVWIEGGISYATFYGALQKGGIASPERDADAEWKLRSAEGDRGDDDGADDDDTGDARNPAGDAS